MKKIIPTAIMLLISLAAFSQSTDKDNYLQKSRNQKTAAFVLLGAGAVVDIIALASFPKDYGLFNTAADNRQANTSAWLFVAGTATILSSIPFFISSHVNKKKALKITIDPQQMPQLKNNTAYKVNYPALTLKLRL